MAPVFGVISDLQPGKSKIGLQLRLVRCYDVPEFNNRNNDFSFECVFHDKLGDRIHASIQRSLISKFKPIMDEGKVYVVHNFVVGNNTMSCKTTTCRFKLLFFKQTRIYEVSDDTFPSQLFNFKCFDKIAALENTSDVVMFDVLGVIVSTYKPQVREINGRQTKLMDFVLEDIEQNTLACTFWEKYANEFCEYLLNEPSCPVGVIIQFCRPTTYRGENRITNSYFATKIIFDDNIEEIKEFKQRYITSNKLRLENIKTLTASSDINKSENFVEGQSVIKTISQLFDDDESGHFWVFATIISIETIGAWAYLACNVCLKKLKPDAQQFYCEKCETFNISGRLRYKLTIRAIDDTRTAPFLLWDRECLIMIGKTAAELSSDGESYDLPSEIESLSERQALFKVEVKPEQKKNYTGAYTVLKVNCDPNIIAKLSGTHSDDEDLKPSNKLDDSISIQEMVGSTSDLKTSKRITKKMRTVASIDLEKDASLKKSLADEFSGPTQQKSGRRLIKKEKT